MGARIDHGAVIMLTVNFHEPAAHRPQHLHADRLIIDEGACAPVCHLDAAENQIALGIDLCGFRDDAGGMIAGKVEDGGNLAL